MSSVELYLEGDSVIVEDDENPRSEQSDEDEEAELSWRLAPERSLADWTLLVATSEETTQYHVHKSMLAVGPRRSNFFVQAFQSKAISGKEAPGSPSECLSDCGGLLPFVTYTDGAAATTRVELEEIAAVAVPECLDFVYNNEGFLDIDTDNACALHYLSYVFEIKALRRLVREFWIKDLNMNNLPTYYEQACLFKDDKVLEYAEQYCIEHIFEVEEENVVKILTVVDPEFFLRVIIASGGSSLRLSLLVAVYCNLHRSELEQDIFLRLTDAQHLPQLETKAALVLLELEDEIRNNSSEITSLKERSIQVLSKYWQDCLYDDDTVVMPKLTGKALEAFVQASFVNANRSLVQAKRLSKADELKKVLESHTKLEKDLNVTKEELARLQAENMQLRRDIVKQAEYAKEEKNLLQQKLDLTRSQLDSTREQLKLQRNANNSETASDVKSAVSEGNKSEAARSRSAKIAEAKKMLSAKSSRASKAVSKASDPTPSPPVDSIENQKAAPVQEEVDVSTEEKKEDHQETTSNSPVAEPVD